MHLLLFYELSDDYLEKRQQFREEHLRLAWKSNEAGDLVLGGAFSDPADKAVLFFNCKSIETVEQFVKMDPYVSNGLVKKWYIRKWTTVVGNEADTPVKP
jgi:uncharacterized protein YciI